MSYTLKSIRFMTAKSGVNYAKATLEDGKEVTIWSDFEGFGALKEGAMVDGDLTRGNYNGKESWTLKSFGKPSTFVPKGQKPAPRAQEIAKTMEVKAQHIEEAQGRRNDAVKLAGTARDATLLTVAMINKMNVVGDILEMEGVQELWQKWRTWLMTEFDQQPPF